MRIVTLMLMFVLSVPVSVRAGDMFENDKSPSTKMVDLSETKAKLVQRQYEAKSARIQENYLRELDILQKKYVSEKETARKSYLGSLETIFKVSASDSKELDNAILIRTEITRIEESEVTVKSLGVVAAKPESEVVQYAFAGEWTVTYYDSKRSLNNEKWIIQGNRLYEAGSKKYGTITPANPDDYKHLGYGSDTNVYFLEWDNDNRFYVFTDWEGHYSALGWINREQMSVFSKKNQNIYRRVLMKPFE